MLSQLINTGERTTIPLERIKTDGGTQMRAALDPDTVQEYLDAMQPAGWGDFPAIVVYYDGTDHWLADGFHRVEAYRQAAANLDQPAALPAEVRSGTRRDAILHAAGANASHGLRRTNADKRRSIETLLRDDDWRHWSDREIARRCNVSDKTVADVRRSLTAEIRSDNDRTYTTKHGTTSTMQTANIGTSQPAETDEERRQRIRDNDRRMKDEINSRFASMTPVGATIEIDSWAAAANTVGSRQKRAESLAAEIMPWIEEYRDRYGRGWRAIAERGNPAHTNSTLWDDIRKEALRRQVDIDDLTLKEAIKQAFSWLEASEGRRLAPTPYKSLAQMDADGEIPPLAPRNPQPDTYASVFAIQSNLRALLASATAADLRTTATHRGGSRWFEARRLLQGATLHYRDRDLVQALNNLADEIEQRERTQPAAISNQQSTISNPEPVKDGALFDYEIDDALAELVRHTNATLDAQIHSIFPGSAKYWADQVSQTLQHPISYQRMTLAMERLMRTLQEERAEQPGFVPIKLADDRIPRSRRLIGIYTQAISVEDEYGALTGCFSETLAAKRELQKMIQRLQRMVDLLEGRTVASAEECD